MMPRINLTNNKFGRVAKKAGDLFYVADKAIYFGLVPSLQAPFLTGELFY